MAEIWNNDKKEKEKMILSFEEIEKGYTKEEAIQEAKRCLHCKTKPCMHHCPAHVAIPEFIEKVANEEWEEAYQIIRQSSCLPEVCGRVCPQEKQCEGSCVRGIKGKSITIGKLERFVADQHLLHSPLPSLNTLSSTKKVGIIGSGPASLGCAQALLDLGYQVMIWEAMDSIGGVLRYGIPNYRLPKELLDQRILRLKKQGALFQTGVRIGKDISLENLKQECDALFLGCGASVSNMLFLSNENIHGIYDAHTFLKICNLDEEASKQERLSFASKKHMVVIGGGNVAMDVARCAKRLTTGKVSIVYRRSMEELPARKEEIEHAIEEGISFCLLTNPLQAISDPQGNLQALQCVKIELIEPDESGRRKPQVIEGSHFIMPVDSLVIAIGSSIDSLWEEVPSLKMNEKGWVVVDEYFQTSIPGIFAGGDAVSGPKTVVEAMRAGMQAAQQIDSYIQQCIDK